MQIPHEHKQQRSQTIPKEAQTNKILAMPLPFHIIKTKSFVSTVWSILFFSYFACLFFTYFFFSANKSVQFFVKNFLYAMHAVFPLRNQFDRYSEYNIFNNNLNVCMNINTVRSNWSIPQSMPIEHPMHNIINTVYR